MKRIFILSLFFILITNIYSYSQQAGGNFTCETADPFCTGTTYQFPAGVNAGSGQPGPFYSCLKRTPNPAWYYLKVQNSGNIVISMHSEPAHDIDFCCWGPFTSENSCTQLTSGTVISCSYSSSASETCNIPNGITGQYYILIITNFSNQPCNIIFSQTSGTGSTDCSILPPPCSNNSPVCAGQTLQFSANTVPDAVYRWSGPDNFSSSLQNPSIPNAQPVNSGNYYVNIIVNGQPSADSSLTEAMVYKVTANAGNDTSINNGVYTSLHGSASGGPGAYHYHWSPETKLVDPDVPSPTTINLTTATLFTLKVTDDTLSCIDEDAVNISIIGGPIAAGALANPSVICRGATTQLQGFGSGGAGTYTYSWTGPDGFSSTLANPTVQPNVTSVYNLTVNDGYNNATTTTTVTVNNPPVGSAGINDTIPYEWITVLHGSVPGGGSHTYSYSWEPANRLYTSNIQDPTTIPLTSSTLYTLNVTDLTTGCVNDDPSQVTVTVFGGPLNANPVATPNWICIGDTAQLHASAGGGSTQYTYSWVSNPPGFTSNQPNPFVHPQHNTSYTVTVNDGANDTTGTTAVYIFPQPVIHLGPPDSVVCVFANVQLDAGNPGSSYLWSNGESTRQISISATGLTPEMQTYSVTVTNTDGCVSSSSINVIFSFDSCVGINDKSLDARVRIYPNPTKGLFTIETDSKYPVTVSIQDVMGRTAATFEIPVTISGKSSVSADLTKLPKGLYLVKLESNKHIKTEKLILE